MMSGCHSRSGAAARLGESLFAETNEPQAIGASSSVAPVFAIDWKEADRPVAHRLSIDC